ncbi:D-alanyl-D-alanine carboxypeptidase family protein [Heyndrickxia oleronia]|uniref:serine-type D-Ala-D-Ala carboxypeptidase n=1 Tax=Heyndrickxia oleronia TaxID=38875 RepID=A0AAW6SRT9_9BACI|nr:D-alanyl-D-alanine carboxypeptidase family protein [Heyndrickxia oleronia]MDH5159990.1 D-alanyl-D-alanine carboxypeptidase [Heyndrickxia oleronia]
MKRFILLMMIVFLLILIVLPDKTFAATPSVSAASAILMDQDSGRILYEKNAKDVRKIASITKIMTAILAIESGKLKEDVKISDTAVRTEGSSIYLKPGDIVNLEDLVYGLMLRSGNDAANAIAEHVGGSIDGFVFLMNQKAEEIGMQNTHFANPNGLDNKDNHFSTAYDMALLTKYAMQNKTYKKISGTKSYKGWANKNRLLTEKYKYCTGGKTGFTKKAKRTLVTTATKEHQNLIAVTLNGPNDWDDHINMFEYGFKNFDTTIVLDKGKINNINQKYLKNHIYIKNKVVYSLTNEEKDKVTIEYQLLKSKKEWKDQKNIPEIVGKAVIYLDEQRLKTVPVYFKYAEMNEKKGWFNFFVKTFLIHLGVKNDG